MNPHEVTGVTSKILRRLEHKSSIEVYPASEISVRVLSRRNSFSMNSTLVASSHFFKSLFSSTLLAMPGAFKNGGLSFSVLGYVLLVTLIGHNMRRLIVSAEYLSDREMLDVHTYDQLVFVAFSTCSARTKRYASAFRLLVNLMFIITYLDSMTISMIFIARNSESIIRFFFPGQKFTVRYFIFFEMLGIMFMNTIRQLKYLSPFSIIASVLLGGTTILCFHYYLLAVRASDFWERRQIGDYSIIRFASIVLVSQSGISIALTLRKSMKKPEHFLKIPGVYCITLILTACLYVPFGFLGFLKFGENTKASILLNFPNDDPEALIVKFITIISVSMTIPIIFYVMFNVFWNNFIRHLIHERNQLSVEYFFRTVLAAVIFVWAMSFPNLGPMVILKGALFHSQLEVIYPPIVEFVAFYPEKGNGRGHHRLIKAILISFFGIFLCISGTIVGIYDLINEVVHQHHN